MKSDFHEIFQECLTQIENGKSIADALEAYPEARDELEPLLRTAMQLSQRQQAAPETGAFHRSRTRMLAHAAELRARKQKPGSLFWLPRYATGIAAVLLFLVITGYGLFTASAQALPGDLLYPVKRSAENLQLEITVNEDQRATLEEAFQERRADEVASLLQDGRVELISFDGHVQEIGAQDWVVGGISVHLDDKTRIIGDIQISDEIEVEGETRTDGYVFAFELHKRYATLQGTVELIELDRWQIDGQIVAINDETEIEDDISLGDNVIALVALDDNAALTLLEVQLSQESDGDLDDQPEADFVEIEFTGEVESIDTNVWVVAGQRLQIDIKSDIDDDISVGDSVVVSAEQRLDGLYALDIELIEADHDDSEESEDADAEDDEADDETDDEMESEEDHEEAQEEEDDEADEDDEEEEEEDDEEDES